MGLETVFVFDAGPPPPRKQARRTVLACRGELVEWSLTETNRFADWRNAPVPPNPGFWVWEGVIELGGYDHHTGSTLVWEGTWRKPTETELAAVGSGGGLGVHP